jgi:hypothetical protein
VINADRAMKTVLVKMTGDRLNVVQLAETIFLTDVAGHHEVMDQLIRNAMSRVELVEG